MAQRTRRQRSALPSPVTLPLFRIPTGEVPPYSVWGVDISTHEITVARLWGSLALGWRVERFTAHEDDTKEDLLYPHPSAAWERIHQLRELITDRLRHEVTQDADHPRLALVGVEEASHSRNPDTNRKLSAVHHAVRFAAHDYGIPFVTVNNSSWKAHLGVTGVGREAEKHSVGVQLAARIRAETDGEHHTLPPGLTQDEIDALGIALWVQEVGVTLCFSRCPHCQRIYDSDAKMLVCLYTHTRKWPTVAVCATGFGCTTTYAAYVLHRAKVGVARAVQRKEGSPSLWPTYLLAELSSTSPPTSGNC